MDWSIATVALRNKPADVAIMNKPPIYLDNHATTAVDERVLTAMLPFFRTSYGNPASTGHAWGWEAAEAVEAARGQLARLIGARPRELVFTSGATEACNLALAGVLAKYSRRGRHLIVSAIEHPAVLDTARHLAGAGAELTELPVDASGRVDPASLAEALRDDTVLVSIQTANNEIGTLQPIAAMAAMARARGALFHTDAAQALAKEPFQVDALGVDLASFSAHKMYGPKGVGALYVRRGVRLAGQIHGGGHERGLRSGTLPVPSIVGFGAAAVLAEQEQPAEALRLLALRSRLLTRLTGALDQIVVNGDLEQRLAGNLNLSFRFVEGEALLMSLKGVALSAGSACSTAAKEPSHVLRAIGCSPQDAHASLRFGIGRFNTAGEIDAAADEVIAVVRRLRAISPLYEAATGSPAGPGASRP